jgi:dihydropyrimidinase
MIDLLIVNGDVVSSTSVARMDVGIKDGKIAFLASPGAMDVEAKHRIDGSGKLVVPGGIDAHVHFNFPLSDEISAQSATWGSRAAAFGGTTTFLDFARQQDDGGLMTAIEGKKDELKRDRPSIDYGLHAMITGNSTLDVLDEMREAITDGVTSFKMFTAFTSSNVAGTGGLYSDDGRIWGVMNAAARHDGTVMVHCEDDSLIAHNIHCLYHEGRQHARNVAEARTALAEEAAIRRMLLLAKRSGAPLYVCHITSRDGLEAVFESRGARTPIYGEVLHHNLSHTAERYAQPDGPLYHTYPGLKGEEDKQALWDGVHDGILDTVSSDDFTFPRAVKLAGQTVDTVSAGHNGIETRMGVFYSEAVAQRRVSMKRFVELTAERPAKLFGLFPQKGIIAPGSDADIVLIDPRADHTIRQGELHSQCDYSVWDGWQCPGYPITTILRGEILVQDGAWVGPEGTGAFVASGRPSDP